MDGGQATVATCASGTSKVLFNTGSVFTIRTGKPTTPDLAWHAETLTSLPAELRKSLDNRGQDKHAAIVASQIASARQVCVAHGRGEILLSPVAFTTAPSDRVTMLVADHLLDHLPLGRSLVSVLGKAGLFDFLEKLRGHGNQTTYRNLTRLLLAGLAASTSGADCVEQLPAGTFKSWLRTFRDKPGTRWDTSHWGKSESPYKCIREIAFAYGRATGNNDLAKLIKQRRSNATVGRFWDDLEHRSPDHIQPWLKLFREWRKRSGSHAKNAKQAFMHLVNWFADMDSPGAIGDVTAFMTSENRAPSFPDWLRSRKHGTASLKAIAITLEQAASLSTFVVERLATDGLGRRYFPIADKRDVTRAKNEVNRAGGGTRPTQATSRPLPPALYELTRSILEEGKDGWPGRSPLCQEKVVTCDGTKTVYCPVLPTLFLSLFTLPLRVGQAKRLDTGEGDVNLFDGDSMTWRPNEGPNAGHWRKLRVSGLRGYAARCRDSELDITGFFVNTNKTGAPYVVPWQNERLHKLFWELRCWQETWAPIRQPIPPSAYVDGKDFEEDNETHHLPHIFPLFRLPADARSGRQGSPPNYRRTNEFWNALMAELERRVQVEDPTYPNIVKRNAKTGQAYSAYYNPHGMRVAGLSAMMQSGVPVEIISKLVAGHAAISMTAYYGNFNPAHVHRLLEMALEVHKSGSLGRALVELRNASLEDARRRAVTVGPDGALAAACAMSDLDKRVWSDTSIGICPWGGTRCSDGGARIRKDIRPNGEDKSIHGPVEGGERNCVRCRHFITGPAWNVPLWLYGTKLARDVGVLGRRIAVIIDRLNSLENQKVGADKSARAKLQQDVDAENGQLRVLQDEQLVQGKSMWSTHMLLEACSAVDKETARDSENPGTVLVTTDESSLVQYTETSHFEQAALLTGASRVFPILQNEATEMERDRFLDSLAFFNNKVPLTFAPLTHAQKRRGQDAFAELMLKRIERAEFQAIEDGSLDVRDIKIADEDWKTVSVALGAPIGMTFTRPPTQRSLQ